MSLIASMAIIVPITPVSAPMIPASAQAGINPDGSTSGKEIAISRVLRAVFCSLVGFQHRQRPVEAADGAGHERDTRFFCCIGGHIARIEIIPGIDQEIEAGEVQKRRIGGKGPAQ